MNFQTTYRLVQQTPLIHFQHDQNGATLRATEVKPKLDRFIIKKMGWTEKLKNEKERNEIRKEYKDWFIGETDALNYKMRIVTNGAPEISRTIDIELEQDRNKKSALKEDARNLISDIYYGNMVSGRGPERDEKVREQYKETVFYPNKGQIELIICCFNKALRTTVDNFLAEFFIVTNFGTMQNKGFGSFIIDGSDIAPLTVAKYLKEANGSKVCYMFISNKPDERNRYQDRRFKDIKTLYGVMKSGLNHNDYHRSYLFEYCHEVLGIGNEKAAMKHEKISPWKDGEPVRNPNNQKAFWDYGDQDYKYVRAMLGIGERIEYITGFQWDENRRRYIPLKNKDTITYGNKTIERLASPIRFKIIDDTVYIYASRINSKIFSKEFVFTNGNGKSILLSTPEAFDIDDFLKWFVNEYNKSAQKRSYDGRIVSYSIGKQIREVR